LQLQRVDDERSFHGERVHVFRVSFRVLRGAFRDDVLHDGDVCGVFRDAFHDDVCGVLRGVFRDVFCDVCGVFHGVFCDVFHDVCDVCDVSCDVFRDVYDVYDVSCGVFHDVSCGVCGVFLP